MNRCARSAATSLTTLLSLFRRSSFTRSATWSGQCAAGVPGRGEYAAVLTLSKPTSRTSAHVRWNCSSCVWQYQASLSGLHLLCEVECQPLQLLYIWVPNPHDAFLPIARCMGKCGGP